jgi:hypothetical protein
MQVQNATTGMIGYGEFTFAADGSFHGGVETGMGALQAHGTWLCSGEQLILRGSHAYALMPYRMLPYQMTIHIQRSSAAAFAGITDGGESVVFWKSASGE